MDLYLMAGGKAVGLSKARSHPDCSREETLRWFDELCKPLRRYLLSSGVSPADADEVVQETFLRLHRQIKTRSNRADMRAWVFQVARNYLRDERKSARYQRTVPLDATLQRQDHFPDPADNPECSLLSEERERRLRAAIAKLPPQQRECILLRSSGLHYREIAEVLGMNINTAGSLVRAAVARLNEDLQ